MDSALPAIPAKRYFTIGEVSELCGVKTYVLRYWEQEFTQLRPMKRRGNRRYYQHDEVLLIRRIRELLYDQGFTISGARNRLAEAMASGRGAAFAAARKASSQLGHSLPDLPPMSPRRDGSAADPAGPLASERSSAAGTASISLTQPVDALEDVLRELQAIRDLLKE
ncbi:MAG: MerR family transcriptional regulator [Rubrivivax sp.]